MTRVFHVQKNQSSVFSFCSYSIVVEEGGKTHRNEIRCTSVYVMRVYVMHVYVRKRKGKEMSSYL
jgi:hypothetical protein